MDWAIIQKDSLGSKQQETVELIFSKSNCRVDKKLYKSHVDGITLSFWINSEEFSAREEETMVNWEGEKSEIVPNSNVCSMALFE